MTTQRLLKCVLWSSAFAIAAYSWIAYYLFYAPVQYHIGVIVPLGALELNPASFFLLGKHSLWVGHGWVGGTLLFLSDLILYCVVGLAIVWSFRLAVDSRP
jgi:hypothetical protein